MTTDVKIRRDDTCDICGDPAWTRDGETGEYWCRPCAEATLEARHEAEETKCVRCQHQAECATDDGDMCAACAIEEAERTLDRIIEGC